jgi:hypothetical protein
MPQGGELRSPTCLRDISNIVESGVKHHNSNLSILMNIDVSRKCIVTFCYNFSVNLEIFSMFLISDRPFNFKTLCMTRGG